MKLIKTLPIIFCAFLFSAHLLRFYGYWPPVILMLLTLTLLSDKRWVLLMWRGLLSLFSVLWTGITVNLILDRIDQNRPWERLALIMGAVVVVNLLTLFRTFAPKYKQMFNR